MRPLQAVLLALLPVAPSLPGQRAAPHRQQDLSDLVRAADPERIERDVRTLVAFDTRHTLSTTTDPRRGIGAARRWLSEEFERISAEFCGGRLSVARVPHRVPAGRRVPNGAEIVNVVATLPGRDPDRLVVLSGHYDSRASDPMDASGDAPGANDDGSGTAAVLEAARLLGSLHPRATLVFLCVAGEEQGLLGSGAQAQLWKQENKRVEAMWTLDIVGGATGSSGKREPMRLRVFSEGVPSAGPRVVGSDNDAPSRQLARLTRRCGAEVLPDFEVTLVFRADRFLRGGDHTPFLEQGWPAVRLTEPHENYAQQHQDVRVEDGVQFGDLPRFVDYRYVARVTRVVAASAAELALAPAPVRGLRIDVRHLTPETRLLFEPSPEPDLAGYAVLLRRTEEPDWTERIEFGPQTEITLERSKDDWLFAVEAVDRAGHRSLPVYPTPKYR